MLEPPAFARHMQQASAAVLRHLANASGAWHGGPPFALLWDAQQQDDGGYLTDAATIVTHTVSLCVANCPGIAEGSAGLTVGGKPCRVTSPVVPDAGGWASFTVTFPGGLPAAGCGG